jgi:protease inhibitor Inh
MAATQTNLTRALLCAALLGALASAATAQQPGKPDPDAVRALAANYELANADGDRKCPITLDAKPAGPVLTLVFDRPACVALFAFLSDVAGWLPGPGGSIRLARANGRPVLEFTEGVGGTYEGIREGDAVYFLTNQQYSDPADAPQFADLLGDWNLSRPGGPAICRISLTDQAAANETFVMRVDANCDATIARLAPVAWRLERGDVLLIAKNGDKLRFGRQEGGDWTKIPDTPRPLVMSRP